jgi:hypothetical protein
MVKQTNKNHVIVDIGPYTILMISELVMILLKVMNYINYSWLLVLSPIVLIVAAASVILLFTFFRILKEHMF